MTGDERDPEPPRDERPDLGDDGPPICPFCGVTMVPAALSARDSVDADWVCLECEETEPA